MHVSFQVCTATSVEHEAVGFTRTCNTSACMKKTVPNQYLLTGIRLMVRHGCHGLPSWRLAISVPKPAGSIHGYCDALTRNDCLCSTSYTAVWWCATPSGSGAAAARPDSPPTSCTCRASRPAIRLEPWQRLSVRAAVTLRDRDCKSSLRPCTSTLPHCHGQIAQL